MSTPRFNFSRPLYTTQNTQTLQFDCDGASDTTIQLIVPNSVTPITTTLPNDGSADLIVTDLDQTIGGEKSITNSVVDASGEFNILSDIGPQQTATTSANGAAEIVLTTRTYGWKFTAPAIKVTAIVLPNIYTTVTQDVYIWTDAGVELLHMTINKGSTVDTPLELAAGTYVMGVVKTNGQLVYTGEIYNDNITYVSSAYVAGVGFPYGPGTTSTIYSDISFNFSLVEEGAIVVAGPQYYELNTPQISLQSGLTGNATKITYQHNILPVAWWLPDVADSDFVMTEGAQIINGAKTFLNLITAPNLTGDNTGDVTLAAVGSTPNENGASLTDQEFNLEPADGSFGGVITTGAQEWLGDKTFSSGVAAPNLSGVNTGNITLTAIGSSPNANGASLSGQILTLQPASSTQPGVFTAGTQTIGGAKTHSGTIAASNVSGTNTGNVTLATFGASANANAASLAGQVLTLQPASTTQPGFLAAASQSFVGAKTFLGTLYSPLFTHGQIRSGLTRTTSWSQAGTLASPGSTINQNFSSAPNTFGVTNTTTAPVRMTMGSNAHSATLNVYVDFAISGSMSVAANITFLLRKNGADTPFSVTKYIDTSVTSVSMNWVPLTMAAGDYIEFWWYGSTDTFSGQTCMFSLRT